MGTEGGLTDLAATLADGQAVDWAALEAELGSEAERAIFRQLRVIAEIAELHRSLSEDASAPDADLRALIESPLPGLPMPASGVPPPATAAATSDLATTPTPADDVDPTLGTWGPYTLRQSLGPGTLGHVMRAFDHLHRDVVIRFLPDPCAPDVAIAFLATGQTLARIRHPNAVEVYGAEQHDDRTGLVMEYVDGRSLDRVVEAQGTFSAREAALVGWELCRAISALHREGVAHGLLAPDNIVREAGGRLVLMDVWPQGVPIDCLALGPETLPFLAPEVAAGAAPSTRADVYSLGVVLYYLVSGAFPVRATSVAELADRHARRERIPLADLRPDLPDDFIRIVERACDPDMERRYPTIAAVKEALSRTLGWDTWTRKQPVVSSTGSGEAVVAAALDVAAAGPPTPTPVPPAPARAPWQLVGIAAGAVLLGGLVAWALLPRGGGWRGYPSSIASLTGTTPTTASTKTTSGSGVRLAIGSAAGADPVLTPLVIEQLAQDLSSSPPFRIVAPAAVEAMQGDPVQAIIQAVDADVFVELAVARRDQGLEARVTLIRAAGPSQIFQQEMPAGGSLRSFTATLTERIAREVAATQAARPSLRTELPLDNPEAMQAYAIGQTRLGRGGRRDVEEAADAFRAATEAKPDFVLAYAKWAEALLSLYRHNALAADDALPLANQIIGSALSIDDRSAEAYAALGDLHAERHNYEQSERYFRRALGLNPSCEYARIRYAMLLAGRGRVEEAVEQVDQAQKLNPRSSLLRGYLGATLHYARRFEDAARTYETLLKLDEKYTAAYIGLCKAYTELKRTAQAMDACRAVGAQQAAEDPFVLSQFVKIHHDAGQAAEAQAALRRLRAVYDARPTGDGAFWLALAYVSLGDHTQALTWLDRAIDASSSRLAYARVDSRLDPLRRDPRFLPRMARIQQSTSSVVEGSAQTPQPATASRR